jgi:RNase P subunit RPR2
LRVLQPLYAYENCRPFLRSQSAKYRSQACDTCGRRSRVTVGTTIT